MESTNVECCFCGPIKQCASFLPAVLKNIKKIGSYVFKNKYAIIVFYDKSSDSSLKQLQNYEKQIQELNLKNKTNIQMHIIINYATTLSPYRTHRIATARNACLTLMKKEYGECPYFIMMDFDDPNSKPCQYPEKLMKYFDTTKLLNQWDALSFQTTPHYYDIWALSIPPFSFSYNHLPNNDTYYYNIQNIMDKKLLNTKQLVPCISAFNGFAIYKTAVFNDCQYSGDIRDSVKQSRQTNGDWIEQHKHVAYASTLVFLDYGNVKGKYEDCEHRPFHMQAIQKHGAKIRISPEILFI